MIGRYRQMAAEPRDQFGAPGRIARGCAARPPLRSGPPSRCARPASKSTFGRLVEPACCQSAVRIVPTMIGRYRQMAVEPRDQFGAPGRIARGCAARPPLRSGPPSRCARPASKSTFGRLVEPACCQSAVRIVPTMIGRYRQMAVEPRDQFGAPGRIRTADHCVRSAVLYPAELRARRKSYLVNLRSLRTRRRSVPYSMLSRRLDPGGPLGDWSRDAEAVLSALTPRYLRRPAPDRERPNRRAGPLNPARGRRSVPVSQPGAAADGGSRIAVPAP